jgi:hypothetical protein
MSEVVERPVQRSLHTIEQFCGKYQFLTTGALRWQVFQSENNGLDKSGALVRIGRRVYIDEPKYFAWVDAQQKRS